MPGFLFMDIMDFEGEKPQSSVKICEVNMLWSQIVIRVLNHYRITFLLVLVRPIAHR